MWITSAGTCTFFFYTVGDSVYGPDWRQFAPSTRPIWNATATFTDYRAHHFASQPIPSCWRLDWRACPGTVPSARSTSRLSCASLQKIRAIKANQVSGTRSAACPRSPLLPGYLPQDRAATGHTGEARCKHVHRRASQDHLALTQGIRSLRCPEGWANDVEPSSFE